MSKFWKVQFLNTEYELNFSIPHMPIFNIATGLLPILVRTPLTNLYHMLPLFKCLISSANLHVLLITFKKRNQETCHTQLAQTNTNCTVGTFLA